MTIFFIVVLFIWLIILTNKMGRLEDKQFKAEQNIAAQTASAPSAQPSSATASGIQAQPLYDHSAVAMAAQAQAQPSAGMQMPSAASQPLPEPVHEKEDTEFVWAKYLARAGVAAILLGVAFFLKLAIEYGWIGIMGRVAIGVIIGLIGIVVGQVLRSKYKAYSDVLIGGGLAVLYVTVFFAHYYYDLIGRPVALGLMIGITALAVIMSVVDKAETLARIGIIGGFLAPLLISIQNTGLFDLFTYALILDIGVLIIAYSKRWHSLNFIAFVGTFILYSVGLMQSFSATLRFPVLLFTTLFFMIFLAVSVMHHFVRKEKSNSLDVVFLTLNAIWYGVAVYGLMAPVAQNLLGFYMLGIAVIYAITALVSFTVDRSDRMLNQYLTGLCVVFLTAAIPMQFDGTWITIMWFLEAVILFAVDYSLKGKNLYALGSVVFGLGLFRYFFFDKFEHIDMATFAAVFNSRFMMLLVIVVISLVLGYIVKKASHTLLVSAEEGTTDRDVHNLKGLGTFFFVVANLLSIYLMTSEIVYHFDKQVDTVSAKYHAKIETNNQYRGSEDSYADNEAVWDSQAKEVDSLDNQRNVAISIAWAIYATALLVFGFMHKSRGFRIAGLAFIFITLLKVFIDIWNFGGIYRVIGSIAVGFIALLGSFLYAKYKDRIKGVLVASLIAAVMLSGAASAFAPHHAEATQIPVDSYGNLLVSQKSFKYVAPINTGNVAGPVSFDIPAAVLTKTTINDIRIYDNANAIVPYIALDGNLAEDSSISMAVTDSTVRGNESMAVFDTGLQYGTIHNGINLEITAATSFARNVSVYGSDIPLPADSASWKLITDEGYIYSYADERASLTARNTTVTYPKNTSRYLKVVIGPSVDRPYSNGGSATNVGEGAMASAKSFARIQILGGILQTISSVYESRDVKTVSLSPAHVSVVENSSEKSTEITIDLGDVGIYSNQISLKLTNPNQQFIRRAVVQRMDSPDGNLGGNWTFFSEGSVFNINQPLFTGYNLTLSYPEVKSRFIRIVIFNKDDQPVSFSQNVSDVKVQSKVRSILFDASAGKTYNMYFGNPTAPMPQYDIVSIKAYADTRPTAANLGAVAENSAYIAPIEAKPHWSESNRMILNVALVILVLVVGGIVYMYVRKIRREDNDGPTVGNDAEQDGI